MAAPPTNSRAGIGPPVTANAERRSATARSLALRLPLLDRHLPIFRERSRDWYTLGDGVTYVHGYADWNQDISPDSQIGELRDGALFQELLSALRNRFGGHQEKPGGQSCANASLDGAGTANRPLSLFNSRSSTTHVYRGRKQSGPRHGCSDREE